MLKTTVIIMGYNLERINNNKDILFKHYDTMSDLIDKIIFIWNNLEKPMPDINMKNVELVKIKAKKNSLCNRHYIVYDHINTESALIIDEDIILSSRTITDLIKTWLINKDSVIGLRKRSYDKLGKYYGDLVEQDHIHRDNPILTIGQTMMYHKKYMKEFEKHKELHHFIDKIDPAISEDLGFQLMVHSINKKPSTIIIKGEIKELSSVGAISKSHSPEKRNLDRSNAIRYFLRYFKMQPIQLWMLDYPSYPIKIYYYFIITYMIVIILFLIIFGLYNALK
tara:strand:- start:1849 stop:2691 length:843 start_codon:yes stop_codon:yes gene_type:complete